MYVTLLDFLPPGTCPPAATPPPRIRQRIRRYECNRYVRKVKGEKFQVRIWLAGFGSVNCGLYDERTAEEVARRLIRTEGSCVTPVTLWRALKGVLAKLRIKGWERLPEPEPLPRYVEEVGEVFIAKVKKGGRVIVCAGPYASPEEAYLAMEARLKEEFPKAVARRCVTLLDYVDAGACAA